MRRRLALALVVLALAGGCRRAYQVGDHVMVDWKGTDAPAVIVAIEGPAKFRVHYDGFSEDWDETVPGTRINGRVTGQVAPLLVPPKGRGRPGASASPLASAAPASVYRVGDRVRVEWHGSFYTATIVAALGAEQYRVHYEGYGNEWDETIGLGRIQRR